MVLQNCRACTDYWLKNGRDMYGYRLLSRDRHIPEAHVVVKSIPPLPSIPPLASRPPIPPLASRPPIPPLASRPPIPPLAKASIPPIPPLASIPIPVAPQRPSSQPDFHPPDIQPESIVKDFHPPDIQPESIVKEAHSAPICKLCSVGEGKTKLPHVGFTMPSTSTSDPNINDFHPPDIQPESIVKVGDGKAKLPHVRLTMPSTSTSDPNINDQNVDVPYLDEVLYCDGEDECDEDDLRSSESHFPDCENNEDQNVHIMETIEIDTSWYFPLYKSSMDGDWETAKQIIDLHGQSALKSKIRNQSETALHISIGSGQRTLLFVQKLIQLSSKEDLELKSRDGSTSLGIAAKVGNVEAAMLIVAKHSKLLYIADKYENYPIHNAAEYGQKEMLMYLLQVTQRGQNPDPYDPEGRGPELLRLIIRAEFYDAALLLLKLMPKLATSGMESNLGLIILAENPCAFSCWRNEGVFLPLIYTCVPNLLQNRSHSRIGRAHDVENADSREYLLSNKSHFYFRRYIVSGLQRIHHAVWTLFERIVPLLNQIKHQKLKGYHAKKLVKCLCREAANNLQKSSDAALLFKLPLLQAAENGIYEIVKEITYSFPDAIWYSDDSNSEVFRLAIKNRHHEVYNLLHEMGDLYVNIVRQSVEDGDNIMHLAGYLAPSDRLRVVSGAALQMQRELQWFKEIESLVQPAYKSKRNKKGKTPQEIFTESHQKLMEEGEKWMRDTANSCTVAATLIATIVFAAAITVPGGNNGENGKPMLGSAKAFIIFGVADALSLFTSCVSILMFLSILTSRYAEGDFLRALPTRLIIGLLTLFISVSSMMVAFSSTLYLIFGDRRKWVLGCVIGPSSLIVAVFASMQFSLLAEMIKSTYRCSIFKRRWGSKNSNMSCTDKRKCSKKAG